MKILCPTDFSDHSKLALDYAINLSNALEAELHILAVFQVNKGVSNFKSMDEIISQNHEEDMKALISGLGSLVKEGRQPISKVAKGSTVDTIIRYAKQLDIDLIVMGTQGSNSLRTKLFGSTTRKLAEKTPIAILAIPETIKHTITSNKIVLALDNKILDNESAFNVPLAIAKHLDQKIDILHIETEEETFPFDPFISSYLGDSMGEVEIKKDKDAISAIQEYAEENNIGLLVMVRREKSFLEKILKVGNTSAELSSTSTPLMIIPE